MLKVHCPRCQKATEYHPSNIYRPFCSERCKLIDFGAWANEEYAIGSQEPLSEEEATRLSTELD